MTSTSKSNNYKELTRRFTRWGAAFCIAISLTGLRNELQATEQEVAKTQSFAQEDLLFKLVYPMPSSREILKRSRREVKGFSNRLHGEIERENGEEGEAENIYNRWSWFYGQRALPNGDIPFTARAEAWQQKMENRNPRFNLDENWSSIGPNNMAGRTLCVVYHPTDSTIIY